MHVIIFITPCIIKAFNRLPKQDALQAVDLCQSLCFDGIPVFLFSLADLCTVFPQDAVGQLIRCLCMAGSPCLRHDFLWYKAVLCHKTSDLIPDIAITNTAEQILHLA